MTNQQIGRMLNLHSVPFYEENGHIFADSMLANHQLWDIVEDLTDYSRRQLLDWLGYDQYGT